MTKEKLTIFDLQEAKRKGLQLTEVHTEDPIEAAAAEAAGIDILVTAADRGEVVRDTAPNTFWCLAL